MSQGFEGASRHGLTAEAARKEEQDDIGASPSPVVQKKALDFLAGRCRLTDAAMVGLHQGLKDRHLVGRILAAKRSGAPLAAAIDVGGRSLVEVVKHPGFEWNPRLSGSADDAVLGSSKHPDDKKPDGDKEKPDGDKEKPGDGGAAPDPDVLGRTRRPGKGDRKQPDDEGKKKPDEDDLGHTKHPDQDGGKKPKPPRKKDDRDDDGE